MILFSDFIIILSCRLPCYSISSRLPNMWHNPVHCLNKILLMKSIWLVWLAFYVCKYIVHVLLKLFINLAHLKWDVHVMDTWRTYNNWTTMYNHLLWAANSHKRSPIKNKKIPNQGITSGTSRKQTPLLEGCPILSTWHESKDAVIKWTNAPH